MSNLARIAFLQRPRTDQLLSLSRVLHVMQRVLVLKHWHDVRKSKSSGPAAEPVLSLLEEACIDSSMLAARALDAFFTTRSTYAMRGHELDICAEHFGYPHTTGFLSKERREELDRHIGHVTMLTSDAAFHASLREDLLRSLGPSRRFVAWILGTEFLDGEEAMREEAQTLLANLQSAAAEVAAQTLKPGTLEMSEDVVKATTACLRAAKSSFGPVFARLIRNAVPTNPPVKGKLPGLGAYGTLTFTGRLDDLDLLLKALSAIQASLGESSESIRILNWLHLSWSELRRKVIHGASLARV
ncbi:hypothetical protein DES53_11836 [Roseimicrobium gellanilyticum]|uniref:Uncharacterized protein n=1 Tax=Roseimicrobium gellanilyticum TaxID=748857 RepID=A0A366H5D9_9BACT|nr:hypothetical protein [Roseimicrobium gellanilyticum]RBP36087.1 hypothetical protein DES53_11836 [Roseimicrobium gellanilyticum]